MTTNRTFIVSSIVIFGIALLALTAAFRLGLASSIINWLRNDWRPPADFADTTPPAAPNYADLSSWLAHPDVVDGSDQLPDGLPQEMAQTDVDVFWVHPTSYFEVEYWNQPVDQARDEDHLTLQASLFSSCCRVYSPIYRQATLAAFYELDGDGADALGLAYQDIEAAFIHYIDNNNEGRPFILAGHSQGTLLLDRLIRDLISGTELENQLVVAYLVGYHVNEPNGIPVCEDATQTGCKVSWNTQSSTAELEDGVEIDICVNPLSWSTAKEPVSAAENLGTIHYFPGEPYPLETEVADAQCGTGVLLVSELNSEVYPDLFGETYYHEYDYSLFYENVRQNTFDRIEAFEAGSR